VGVRPTSASDCLIGRAEKADRRRSLMSDADEPKPNQSCEALATDEGAIAER
jgi:hypothetical protein